MSNILYTWKFNDNKNRGTMWYIIALSIVIGLAIWGIFTKQYGMSVIILLIAGVFYYIDNNSEDEVEVVINELGIKIGSSFYDFSKIESYSLIYNGDKATFLRLELNRKGLRFIDLDIDNSIALDIKGILINYLKENPKGELKFSEKIISLLKL